LGFVEDIKNWFGSEKPVKKRKAGKWSFDESKARKK
jgi:hypothetical protein